MTLIEAIAVVFGLACVWLVVKESIWCWPAGLVQVSLYVYIFYQAKLYSDFGLHIFYVGMQFYGWYHWMYGGKDRDKAPIEELSRNSILIWSAVCLLGSVAWGWLMHRFTDAVVPYPDAFTTVTSLVAQWLMAKKKLQNWHFWIAVDIVAVAVYAYKELYLTSGLYAVFLVLCVMGVREWRAKLSAQAA
ncbi:nicotinamide riboside transporter PnuC [Pelagicoccus albus]|uniref:Nicotinamide riboside transporter PnuC n=1 Tax=Pelagicoccus albus TaxID=415222 RepID=A0A7X1B7G9_9BACT|nr:nicotinamide riboside transporter PnuC [Pelagicoccus albus]MBC2607090.1 nicotinamide mononucleotide transporter [Pelagicoccus albus]